MAAATELHFLTLAEATRLIAARQLSPIELTEAYLNRIAAVVKSANREHLLVVLAAFEDLVSGTVAPTGLPSSDTVEFWKACAAILKDTPGLIFDVFNQPSILNIPGSIPGKHRPEDWNVWLNGGVLANGQRSPGMQALVDAIRSTGAQQVVAVSSFHDGLDFDGTDASRRAAASPRILV